MIVGLSTQTSSRREDRSRSTTTVGGTTPVSHGCADPRRLSASAFVLLFSVATISSFVAGRILSRSVNSMDYFEKAASSSFPSLHSPAAQTASPHTDRATHFVEIGGGGNLLGPSASSLLTTTQQSPSRVVDNVGAEVQSGGEGQARRSYTAQVEHLVHSALLTHTNPVRVAILGDEDGMITTEVLKHSTVSDLEVFVLSGSVGAASVPRVTRIHVDPSGLSAALLQRSKSNGEYDVLLWNRGLDQNEWPSSLSTAGILKVSAEALSNEGFVSMTAIPTTEDRTAIPDEVEQAGFESLLDYESGKTRFWLAMKDRETRASWFGRNQAEAELLIRKRLSEMSTRSFHTFGAAEFTSQKFPPRISEDVWCRQNGDVCGDGHGFDPSVPNTPTSSFQVKLSGVGDRAGRGIFASQHVPKGSTIGMDTCVHGMFVPPSTYRLLTSMYFPDRTEEYSKVEHASDLLWKPVHSYVYGYGWVDSNYGEPAAGVDASILTYTNHGCNGTYNTGTPLNVTERSAVLGIGPAANGYVAQGAAAGAVGEEFVYNPYRDRLYPDWGCDDTSQALRDIDAGEELLDNYLVFGGSESGEEWEDVLIELKRMCSGGVGTITQYEDSDARGATYGYE